MEKANPVAPVHEVNSEAIEAQVKEMMERVARSKEKQHLKAEDQSKLTQLRLSFNNSLAKLSDASTKEVGLHKLQAIIKGNTTSQALHVYLGSIANASKDSTGGKELRVLLLGFIAKAYNDRLRETTDKTGSLNKTVIKMCEIVRKYLPVTSTHTS
eukprot:TRINITY_DN18775_c0_g1_i1.p2 TRINITY_DN18775_c0_g1~~TRINITY_DN18775_c0_g1_i1.p2  ORF type:complete len:156 (+),score=33.53 TRINITY_DN18775_c0_g1_i1:23-490(+)